MDLGMQENFWGWESYGPLGMRVAVQFVGQGEIRESLALEFQGEWIWDMVFIGT